MNEKKAFELYQKGADLGDLRSKVSMAECLIEGWGTDCDLGRAYRDHSDTDSSESFSFLPSDMRTSLGYDRNA